MTSAYDGLEAFIAGGITSFTGGPSMTVPFLLASSESLRRGGDEEPAVVGDAVAEPKVAEQLGQGVASGDAVGVHARCLREVDVGLRQRLVIELIAQVEPAR